MFDKMGGRKFIMGLIVMIIGLAIELKSDKGLSTEMAALMTMIYATFSASNAIVTNKELSVKTSNQEVLEEKWPPQQPVAEEPSPQPAPAPVQDVEEVKAQLMQLGPLLGQLGSELAQLKQNQSTQAQNLNSMQKGLAALLAKNV
jgi:hypothetical protein